MFKNKKDKRNTEDMVKTSRATEQSATAGEQNSGEWKTVEEPQTENKTASPEENKTEKPKTPEEMIGELRIALAEMQSKYLYLQADYQNFRKRASRDASDARHSAIRETLQAFLDVADYLRMADVAATKSDNIESIRQGLNMIIAQFDKALDECGVKRMTTIGEKFDPQLHEAVKKEISETVPEGVIISEWNSGYMLGSQILRAPRVIVSAGKTPEPSVAPEPEQIDEAETEKPDDVAQK